MINKELELIIEATIIDAKVRHHEYLTVEHLLYAVLHDALGVNIIVNCGGNVSGIKSAVEDHFLKNIPLITENSGAYPQETIGFQRVIQRALNHVRSSRKAEADSGDLLAAIFLEADSHAVHILEKEAITRLDVINYLSHGVSKAGESKQTDAEGEEAQVHREEKGGGASDPLKLFTVDLIEKAASKGIDELVGREIEVERTIQVLGRRRKNNVILVGEPGVGKTAIVEGLALKIHNGQVPEPLKKTKVYSLDMGSLIAGTRFRGDFEARLKSTIKAIEKIPGAVLFIDEIHTIVGAGAVSGGSMDASNILKPVLNSGAIRCIGASTYEEYKNHFEKDRALSRRFQKLEVHEPDVEEALRILEGLKAHYEEFHGVKYTQAGLRAAAELSSKYINDRHLPDKAIDVIDEAGAIFKMAGHKRNTIGVSEIEKVVARIAQIPPQTVSASDVNRLAKLEKELKKSVFGQDEAIVSLVSSIKRNRAGMGNPDRPIGSFLLLGPTGVGKTEVSKQLAAVLGIKFLRFDMSEYMEKHAVARLIGAPPGYVGFDQGGLLTDAVRKNPYSVLLLDEIEKAHPDVFNVLLQVMDYATLTDNNGKRADFRNVILIMTSNAGAKDMGKSSMGFMERAGDIQKKGADALKELFTPEFRNRLDSTIFFNPLSAEIMKRVVDKYMAEVKDMLHKKKVVLTISDDVRNWLAEKGYDPAFGARPLGRLIQTEIKDALSDEVLFGRLKKGGSVSIKLKDGKPSFLYS